MSSASPMFFCGDAERHFQSAEAHQQQQQQYFTSPTAQGAGIATVASKVSVRMADNSCPTVELAQADPQQGPSASWCFGHIHTAVALCPPDCPLEALKVFKWSATAILGVVEECLSAGGSPFEDGGLVEMKVISAIKELDAIRDEWYLYFDEECIGLDQHMTFLWEEPSRLKRERARARAREERVTNLGDLYSTPAASPAPASPSVPAPAHATIPPVSPCLPPTCYLGTADNSCSSSAAEREGMTMTEDGGGGAEVILVDDQADPFIYPPSLCAGELQQ